MGFFFPLGSVPPCLSLSPSVPAADSSGAVRWPPSTSFILNYFYFELLAAWGILPIFHRLQDSLSQAAFAAWQSSGSCALSAVPVPAADLFPQLGSVSALLSNALPRTPSSFPHEVSAWPCRRFSSRPPPPGTSLEAGPAVKAATVGNPARPHSPEACCCPFPKGHGEERRNETAGNSAQSCRII